MKTTAALIEDNYNIRAAITTALRELAEVDVIGFAEDAESGLELLANHACDFLVLDMFLKAGSGLDVLAGLRRRNSQIPVFVLTNYATDESRRRCIESGALVVYDKSTELDAFFDHCISFVAQRQAASFG